MANVYWRKKALIALGCAALLCAPAPAAAAPVTWEWLGSITSSTIPGIAVNSNASLLVTFELTSPDLEPSPSCGIYYPSIVSATGNFGGRSYSSSGGGAIEVQQGGNFGCGATGLTVPTLTFRLFGGILDGSSILGGVIAFFEIGPPLASDALPLVPPSPFSYQNSGFRLDLGQGPICCFPTAIAQTQAVRVVTAVPEPASFLLIGAGFAGLARRRFKGETTK